MPYLYLIGSVIFASSESILGTYYNRKNEGRKDSSPLYSFLCMCSVFVFWTIMFCKEPTLDWNVVWYALLFAFFYTLCNVCMIYALKTGPMALTSLFVQLALVGTTIWGFFFWDAKVTWLVAFGLAMVVLAIWLCLYQGKNAEGEKTISLKWLIYAVLACVGNAGCSITQRSQQIKFDGQYGNFLMMIATAVSVAICLSAYIKSDRKDTIIILKDSWYVPVGAGALNGVLNLFVILLATSTLSPTLIYPVIGVGSLMLAMLVSAMVFKEKMHWWQWLGVAVGAIAVALLSM